MIYELRDGNYDEDLLGRYRTLREAKAAIPGALWRKTGEGVWDAFHPDFPEHQWSSHSWYEPRIVRYSPGPRFFDAEPKGGRPEVPEKPLPPEPPRCRFRQEWPQAVCDGLLDHEGPHHLVRAAWTSDLRLVSSAGITHVGTDGSVTTD